MHKSDITYEQLGRAFRRYLSERFDGDAEEVSLTAETAERIIPNTLNDYFGTQYASIYDITEIGDRISQEDQDAPYLEESRHDPISLYQLL